MRGKLSRCLLLDTFLMLFALSAVFSTEVPRKPSKVDEDWRLLQQAQSSLESAEYGNALLYAEQAKQSREQECAWKIYVLDNAFKGTPVKKAGDNLTSVIDVLKERSANNAIEIIQKELDKHDINFFGNSVAMVKKFISEENIYPEADFIIGKIYMLEGENELALSVLEKAYSNKSHLDVPEQKYDILYTIADICQNINDINNYEKYLVAVLMEDAKYTNSSYMNSMIKIISINKENSIEKLFSLYRVDDLFALKASYKLAKLYAQTGRGDDALRCTAFGAVLGFTKLYSVMSERSAGFTYEDLQDMLTKCSRYADIVEWGKDENVWELFYMLAENSGSQGYLIFSRKLYKVLSLVEPDEYWRIRANDAFSMPSSN